MDNFSEILLALIILPILFLHCSNPSITSTPTGTKEEQQSDTLISAEYQSKPLNILNKDFEVVSFIKQNQLILKKSGNQWAYQCDSSKGGTFLSKYFYQGTMSIRIERADTINTSLQLIINKANIGATVSCIWDTDYCDTLPVSITETDTLAIDILSNLVLSEDSLEKDFDHSILLLFPDTTQIYYGDPQLYGYPFSFGFGPERFVCDRVIFLGDTLMHVRFYDSYDECVYSYLENYGTLFFKERKGVLFSAASISYSKSYRLISLNNIIVDTSDFERLETASVVSKWGLGNFHDIYPISRSDIVIAGSDGLVMKTLDGGNTWVLRYPETSLNIESVFFSDSLNGWMAGENSYVARSTDGGDGWVVVPAPGSGKNVDIRCFSNGLVYIIQPGLIASTADGGVTWQSYGNSNGWISEAFFIDPNTGWAVGNQFGIYSTIDGGANWATYSIETHPFLVSVFFTDSQTGYTAGHGGYIFKTADAGVSWNRLDSKTAVNINSIYFPNQQEGWAVGDSGTILYTGNAGADWSRLTKGTTYNLTKVYFYDDNTGWILGQGIQILFTEDHGKNWIIWERSYN